MANHVRLEQAAFKRYLGELSMPDGVDALLEALGNHELMTGPVGKLRLPKALMSITNMGPTKVDGVLRDVGVFRAGPCLKDVTRRQADLLQLSLRQRIVIYRRSMKRTPA